VADTSVIFCGHCGKSTLVYYDSVHRALHCFCGAYESIGVPGRFPFVDRDGNPVNREAPFIMPPAALKDEYGHAHTCPYCVKEGKDGTFYTRTRVKAICCPGHRKQWKKDWYERRGRGLKNQRRRERARLAREMEQQAHA
jgi:hypothetical protein